MNKHFTLRGMKIMCLLLLSTLFFTSSFAQSTVATRSVSNTTLCTSGETYGIYILFEGEDPYHTLQWASFTEFDDGTATLTGAAVNNSNPSIQFNVNLTFTGRTFTAPAGSPKSHVCSDPDPSDWYYYTSYSGTYMGVGQCWGTTIEVEGVGEAFQVGNGANVTNDGSAFSASGWNTLTLASQNSWGPQLTINTGNNGQNGDINIDLSGQGLTPPGACNNVSNGGQIGGTQTVCAGESASTLTNAASPTGGSGTIEYLWLSSTTACPTSLNQQIAGATSATYNPGVLTETTYFVRCSRRAGCSSWTEGESNCVTVTIDNSDNCNGGGGGGGGGTGDCADITISGEGGAVTVSGLGGAPITSVQVFNSSWGQEFSCFADCDSPTQEVSLAAGTYFVFVKFYNASYQLICEKSETVTVTTGGGGGGGCDNVSNGGMIAGTQTICAGEAAATLTSMAAPTGGSGAIEYLWLSSTTACPTNINQQIPGATGATYNPGVLTETTYFVRCSRRAGCDAWTEGESNCVTVTVDNSNNCGGGPTCAKYAITDSDPECGGFANLESGVFYQRDCGATFTVWQAGPNLMLTENGDGTALISGTITSGNQTGIVSIDLGGYDTNGENWGNTCYNDNLTPEYFYTSFSGTITVGNETFTIEQKAAGTDFVFGPGANNQSDGSLGIGAWTAGTFGSCIEMFGSLTPLNPGDACDDGDATTSNDVIQADGCTCAGTPDVCEADAGSLNAVNANVELNNGSAVISATAGGGLAMPAGFDKIFVLTQGANLVIQEVSNDPSFTVTAAGSYRIHTLVYDPSTLDLGIVQFGTTTGGDVNALLIQGGGTICASLDVAGALFSVTEGNGGGGGGGDIDLELTADGTGGNVGPYANFSVTFTLTNAGGSTATDVEVSIPQPSNAVFQGGNAAQTSQGSYDPFGSFTWTVGDLAPGQTETITLNYFSLANPPYTVYGQVQAAGGNDTDSTPGNGTAPTPNEDDEAVFTTGDGNGGGGGGGGGGEDTCPLTLNADVTNIQCNNNGTPEDASDDTFTFNVTVTGGNPWGWTGGGRSGQFGTAVTFGPYDISAGNVAFTIVDNDNQTCTVDVNVTPPATCSDGNGGGGGGGGGGGSDDCSDITITPGDNKVTISGLDNAPLTAVWVFNSSWGTEFNCSYGCNATEMVDLAPGTYQVVVKKLNPDWSVICEVNETITIEGGGGGGDGVLSLTCPDNVTVTAAPGANLANVSYPSPVWSTTCTQNGGGLSLTRIAGPASGSDFPVGTTTVTFQSTDNCGNSETCSFTVTVNASAANLVINCPNNITVNAAPGANSAVVTFPDATANTTCGAGNVSVTQTAGPASGSAFPAGTTTVTYTAIDNCGNSKTCSFTVTVNTSNSNVTINCPANITVDAAPGADSAVVTYGNADANTNCAQGGLNVVVDQGPASGSAFPVGTTTVKYKATDACGSMAMCTFTVTVNEVAVQPCETRTVTAAANNCTTTTATRAFFGNNLLTNVTGDGARYNVQNGVLKEFADGTAQFTGRFVNEGNANVIWNATVNFSGRTFGTPAGSPKASGCYNINDSDFYYYTQMSGTLTGAGLLSGGKIQISLLGEAFQVGTGANLFDQSSFGASTWLDYTIVSQPSGAANIVNGGTLDFNWRLTGGQLNAECGDDQSVDCDDRVSNGLIALYDFTEGNGTTVNDVSGFGQPLNLHIQNPDHVDWLNDDCGVNVTGNTKIQSADSATKIANAVSQTNMVTVEAWVRPSTTNQGGPARIATISENTGLRNITLGQEHKKYVGRLRTTQTTDNGLPELVTGDNVANTTLQHVVYTRKADGQEQIFVNGVLEQSGTRNGNLSNWATHCKLTLANENTGDRPWTGRIYKVAIYNQALSQAQITQNFNAGRCCASDNGGGGGDACGGDVLFVVGDTNLNTGDQAVRNRLQSLGYTVQVIDQHDANTADANGKALVVISSTVLSTTVNTTFKSVGVPVLTWESYLFDDMHMTGSNTGVSYGGSDNVSQFTVATSHPITSGFSGTINIFNSGQHVRWGLPAANANDIGYVPNNPTKCMIIVYDAGQAMVGGFTAPARRAGFFLDNESAAHLNANGWTLFERTVHWLTNCNSALQQFATNTGREIEADAELREEGTSEFTPVEFKVYPNPATDMVNVALDAAPGTLVTINVYDQLGRIVERAEVDNTYQSVYRFNTADFNAGMYMISVQAANEPVKTKQLVILPH